MTIVAGKNARVVSERTEKLVAKERQPKSQQETPAYPGVWSRPGYEGKGVGRRKTRVNAMCPAVGARSPVPRTAQISKRPKLPRERFLIYSQLRLPESRIWHPGHLP